jgi:hypothetical protein
VIGFDFGITPAVACVDDIVVTHAMIEAGARALRNFDLKGSTSREGAEIIYRAMESARLKHKKKPVDRT